MYPKCWTCLSPINLFCKDHKSSDNLLYLHDLFSVKHIKQILVKHSIKKGERLEEMFSLWDVLNFLESLMRHRCFKVPTRRVSHNLMDPQLMSETLCFPSFSQKILPSSAEWTQVNLWLKVESETLRVETEHIRLSAMVYYTFLSKMVQISFGLRVTIPFDLKQCQHFYTWTISSVLLNVLQYTTVTNQGFSWEGNSFYG